MSHPSVHVEHLRGFAKTQIPSWYIWGGPLFPAGSWARQLLLVWGPL